MRAGSTIEYRADLNRYNKFKLPKKFRIFLFRYFFKAVSLYVLRDCFILQLMKSSITGKLNLAMKLTNSSVFDAYF